MLNDYGQTSRPRGSGSVQVFDVPLVVITTVAVAEPLYVTTSRRVEVVGVPPVIVMVTFISRRTLPAVG